MPTYDRLIDGQLDRPIAEQLLVVDELWLETALRHLGELRDENVLLAKLSWSVAQRDGQDSGLRNLVREFLQAYRTSDDQT